MSSFIQFKTGRKSTLPSGSTGEPLYTNDTNELYMGQGESKPPIYIGGQKQIAITDVDLLKGQPVYIETSGHIGLAQAVEPYQTCIGLSDNAYTSGSTAAILDNGLLVLPDWTNITGTTNLILNNIYYLDYNNAGKLTNVPPVATGNYCLQVGRAINITTLLINIGREIGL